jgi:hypothetical protein
MENCVVIEERGTGKLRESLGDCNRCSSSYCAGWRDVFFVDLCICGIFLFRSEFYCQRIM